MSVVYILEKYDLRDKFDYTQPNVTILNVFSSMEKAIEWRDRYIKDESNIEDDFEGDLQRESPVEFFVSKYQVLE